MKRPYLALATLAFLIWTVFLAAMLRRELRLEGERITGIALSQARTLFHQIVDMRTWNTEQGGVYVAVTERTPPNPYLAVPHRDLTTTSGTRLTLVNPAYMTRQLSDIVRRRHNIRLHLTSTRPLRPGNEPDSWEREALLAFEGGVQETYSFTAGEHGEPVFRYMAALAVEEPCLECHRAQGYRVGEVRGGLSITYHAAVFDKTRADFRFKVLLASLALWLFGSALVVAVATAWRQKSVMMQRLRELALADELTALNNRRGFLLLVEQQLQIARRSGHRGLLLFLDLDSMKAINDVHGHPAGDEALRRTADVLRATFRGSDILARAGGDEFMVFCPETGAEAEPAILASLEKNVAAAGAVSAAPGELSLSVGAAEFDPARPVTLERLINEADARMYERKLRKKKPAGR
jgi:diguanylate cyclase (GGDEF)-like protein